VLYGKFSPINSRHYVKLYPQNGDRIVVSDFVASCHAVYIARRPSSSARDAVSLLILPAYAQVAQAPMRIQVPVDVRYVAY